MWGDEKNLIVHTVKVEILRWECRDGLTRLFGDDQLNLKQLMCSHMSEHDKYICSISNVDWFFPLLQL